MHRRSALALLLPLAACVTYEVPDETLLAGGLPLPAAVAVPLPSSGATAEERAIHAWYGSVVGQMQDALLARDLPLLEDLLARHRGAAAPEWAKEQIELFARGARVLAFELHAAEAAVLEADGGTVPLGAIQRCVLHLHGDAGTGIRVLGAEGRAPARFLVAVTISDHDWLGDHTERRFSHVLTLPRSQEPGSPDGLSLAFAVDGLTPEGCLRRSSITVDLLPGVVVLEGREVPNRRVRLGALELTSYPENVEVVRRDPLANLVAGLRLADPRHFDNVFLAAHFMADEQREAALEELIRHLRVGRADVGRLCMACLRVMTGVELSVDDRLGWLRWWESRASTR